MNREEIEYNLGQSAVVFSSQQRALEACLEVLGVQLNETSCVFSVCSPSWVVSAVLRAGGTPVLVDIEEDCFRWSYEILEEASKEEEEFIYIDFMSLSGAAPYKELLKGKVVIEVDARGPTDLNFYTFSIRNLRASTGAVAYCAYSDLKKTLKEVRSGVLGMGDEAVLQHKDSSYCHTTKVEDAEAMKVLLDSHGIQSRVVFRPLHTYEEVAKRYKEKPVYENADKVYNKYIQLTDTGINKARSLGIKV